ELAHVAYPVRLEDRLSPCDRKRMEGADRPLRVHLKIVEIRRGIPVRDAVQNAQMDLQRFLNLVEDPPYTGGIRTAGSFLDLAIGEHINIKFRADELQRLRQGESLKQRGRLDTGRA